MLHSKNQQYRLVTLAVTETITETDSVKKKQKAKKMTKSETKCTKCIYAVCWFRQGRLNKTKTSTLANDYDY